MGMHGVGGEENRSVRPRRPADVLGTCPRMRPLRSCRDLKVNQEKVNKKSIKNNKTKKKKEK